MDILLEVLLRNVSILNPCSKFFGNDRPFQYRIKFLSFFPVNLRCAFFRNLLRFYYILDIFLFEQLSRGRFMAE